MFILEFIFLTFTHNLPTVTFLFEFFFLGSNSKPAPPDGLDSGGGNCLSTRSIIIIFLLGLIPLLVFAAPTAYENWKHREISFEINLHEASKLENYFDKSLDKLEQKYSYQEEKVWYTLAAGIKFVPKNKPNRPSVFMFLYDSESAGITAKCLAKDASYLASIFLKQDTKRNPVILAGLELNEARLIEDPGRLLVDYNRTLQDNGAMVVTDLQDVPAEVAKSLHFFCDAYSPLVESAVYIFTLKVDSIPKHQRSGTARDKLTELWADKMPDGTIEALITRLTPNVIAINSDTTDC